MATALSPADLKLGLARRGKHLHKTEVETPRKALVVLRELVRQRVSLRSWLGEILTRAKVYFDIPQITSGTWECEQGASRWEFLTRGEVIYVLSGRMTVHEDGGEPVELTAGSSCIFPIGWTGTWTVHETRSVAVASTPMSSSLFHIRQCSTPSGDVVRSVTLSPTPSPALSNGSWWAGDQVRSSVVQLSATLAGALATCEAIDHLPDVEVNRLQDLHKEVLV
jgi:uncharacterized cupin superfamily protein